MVFTEIPICSIYTPFFMNLWFVFLKKFKYRQLESERQGTGSGSASSKKNKPFFKKILNLVFKHKTNMLTTDGNFKEKINYLIKKSPDYSTMILHPKLLNSHTFTVLNSLIADRKINFLSLSQLIAMKQNESN